MMKKTKLKTVRELMYVSTRARYKNQTRALYVNDTNIYGSYTASTPPN